MRPSTVHALPLEIRRELDHKLLTERQTQLQCHSWLQGQGYRISKSAFNRYAIKLFEGSEDIKTLSISGQPLGLAIAETIAATDPVLAELMQEIITLQVRQLTLLQKLRDHMRDRQRDDDAKAWLQAQREGSAA